ncbi:dTDP-glucose 4,6-dehydratase [Candidatus Zixiibacteriota bacterium]
MELKGKKAMVTGGAGFIGSTLVGELLKEDVEVVVYDNFVSGDLSNLAEVVDRVEVVEGDILDPDLDQLMNQKRIDCVFNLAAEPYIPHCYDRPRKFFEVNATGAMNVMLACKKAGVGRVLQYSSSEVYGSAQYVPMDEHHPLSPLSTYAVSKLAADRLCYSIFMEQNLPIIILRQFNTYGPRETHPYIIPELITQLDRGNRLKLGNVKARRDLTYVEDSARGAIQLMKCDQAVGEVVNLGQGQDWSVAELAEIIGRLMGHDSVEMEVEQVRLRPMDVERLHCSYFKAMTMFGYRPTIALEEGLRRTIEWYRQNGGQWVWETKMAAEEDVWQGGGCDQSSAES